MKFLKSGFYFLLLFLTIMSCKNVVETNEASVKTVIDNVVTHLYEKLSPSELDTISDAYVLKFLTNDEKEVLATKFWTFDVNVPSTVSLMRDINQGTIPFWIEKSGFKKTGMLVKNEEQTYEVWQKKFEAGHIGLGINGFDKHRPVYFISVAPTDPKSVLKITNVYPSQYNLSTMEVGAFTYHDWDSLILTVVPESLVGQVLFTTVRGRAREAHLTGAFRKTLTPSTTKPDQILLTWSGDSKSTMDVQWRANATPENGLVKYWRTGTKDTLITKASAFKMEDRLLQNDRYVQRFTANLTNLTAGTAYQYKVGSAAGNWSESAGFNTQADNKNGFSYIWFGDTHHSKIWGNMAQKAFQQHPEAAFYQIAGDLVTTGLHRDEWDELWNISGNVFSNRPLMPVPGNHDSQDGLGAGMYQEMFSLPKNGPKDLPQEMTYSYTYQDALFLMIDCTLPVCANNLD